MKLARLFFFALLALLSSLSLAQYPQAWSAFKDLGQPVDHTCVRISAASGGGYFLAGTIAGSTVLSKVADTGSITWTRICPGITSDMTANSAGEAIAGTVSSSFFVDSDYYTPSFTVQRFDTNGNLIWSKTIPFDSLSGTPACHLVMDLAGNVFVEDNNGSLLKLDAATRTQLWSVPIAFSSNPPSVATDSSGSVYVVTDGHLYKYSGAGAPSWNKTFEGTSPLLKVDTAGNVFLIYNASKIETVKYDTNGNVIWNAESDAPAFAQNVAISTTGAVALSGGQFNGATITRISAAGVFQWTKSANGNGGPVGFDGSDNAYVVSDTQVAKYDTAGNLAWAKALPNIKSLGCGVVLDSLGRIAVLYPFLSPTTSIDFGLAVFTTAGTPVWTQNYNTQKSFDKVSGSVTDGAGNTYVAGLATGGLNPYAIARFTSVGGVSWARTLPPLNGFGHTIGPRLTSTGGVIIGQSATSHSVGVFCYDISGTLLWSFIDNVTVEELKDLRIAPDGSIYLLIAYAGPPQKFGQTGLRVVKLGSAGNVLWTRDRAGSDFSYVNGACLAVDASNNVWASYPLEVGLALREKPTITKYDSAGNLQWSTSAPDPDDTDPNSDGDAMVIDSAGNSYLLASYNGSYLFKFNSAGVFQWSELLDDTLAERPRMAIDSSNNIFILGFSGAGFELQRFDTSGVRAWSRSFAVEDHDFQVPVPIVPDGAGGAYIASDIRSNSPTTSVRFSHVKSNGGLAWPASGGLFKDGAITRYSGNANSKLGGMGVDAQGNVFTAVSSFGPSGTYDFNVIKYIACDSIAGGQFTTTQMAAGQTYQVAVVYQNTGLETWTNPGGYRLITLNSSTWGIGSIYLTNSDAIAPGQSKTFYFYVTAPATPGVYNLQTKMYRNGFGSFGVQANTPNVTVTVRPNAARNVSMNAPPSVKAGTTFQVSVDMLNVGTNTWTLAGGHVLAPTTGFPIWNAASIPLSPSDSIAKGAHKVFTFNCTAPASPGSYKMSWQMKAGAVFFGDQSIAKTITVTP